MPLSPANAPLHVLRCPARTRRQSCEGGSPQRWRKTASSKWKALVTWFLASILAWTCRRRVRGGPRPSSRAALSRSLGVIFLELRDVANASTTVRRPRGPVRDLHAVIVSVCTAISTTTASRCPGRRRRILRGLTRRARCRGPPMISGNTRMISYDLRHQSFLPS